MNKNTKFVGYFSLMQGRSYIISLLLVVFGFQFAYPQCKIITPSTHICRNNSLTLTTSAKAFKYRWESGTGKTEDKQTVTFFYENYGYFTIKLRIFDSSLKEICRDSFRLRVFDLPVANADVKDTFILCDNNASLCFTNLSLPGAQKAPISEYQWLFGDGASASVKDPCHKYQYTGSYYLFLKVKDTNQCENHFRKLIYLNISPKLKPYFQVIGQDSCPKSTYYFINYTDTVGKSINKWIWDFGDGTIDSTSTKWSNFQHTYTINGIFSPVLTVINKYGCKESFTCYSCARNVIFTFKINSAPQTVCYGTTVYLSLDPNAAVDNVFWDFDDPASGTSNKAYGWKTSHGYSNPGTYSPAIFISQGKCKLDTVLCDHVVVMGPRAIINARGKSNSYRRNKRMFEGEFEKAFGCCSIYQKDSLIYTTLSKTAPFINGYDSVYCNAGIIKQKVVKTNCGYDTQTVIGFPTQLIPRYDSIKINYHVAYPGDKFPGGEIYYPPFGTVYPYNMHDTDLFKPDCSAPNYVLFTNNTLKYRGYKTIDNNPPFSPGTPGSDRCKNPSFPGVSDSLQFFWIFDDPAAVPCTSTTAKPNMKCNFSTEELPWHLYSENGCYWVKMFAHDRVTKCTSFDSVKILMMPPRAGYDTSKYTYLNWYLQRFFNGKDMGLVLSGGPCLNSAKYPDLRLTDPECGPNEWGIVFDSAQDCSHCCTDTLIYDQDGDLIPDTILHHTDTCNWISSEKYISLYHNGYMYDNPGCKTVGLYIRVGDCVDTFWYHNYINIQEYDPRFHFYFPANDSSTFNPNIVACPPFAPSMIIDKAFQEGVTDYYYILKKVSGPPGYPAYSSTIHCTKSYDTLYKMCHKDSFVIDPVTKEKIYTNCILYPDATCAWNSKAEQSLSSLLKDLVITDTIYLLSLTDTLTFTDSILYPGLYELRGHIVGTYGCTEFDLKTIGVGHQTSFFIGDTILCRSDSLRIFDMIGYYGNSTFDSLLYFEWDFNGDSIWELPCKHDPVWLYTNSGKHKIRLHVYDSLCGTESFYESTASIYINGMEADFDTLNSPGVCAPQVVSFLNKTKESGHYYYIFNSAGQIIDSALIDPVNFYYWDFGDSLGRHSESFLENPKHVYYTNGVFSVQLIAQTVSGCRDTLLKEDYISIDGPVAGFNLLDTLGCVPFTAKIINLAKEAYVQIWDQGDGQQVSTYKNFNDTATLYYPKAGVYYVELIVTDSVYDPFFNTYTSCSAKYPDFYSVNVRNKVTVLPLNPSAFVGDTLICSGSVADFTDRSDAAYTQILWNFGDGDSMNSLKGQNVSHIFTLPANTYSAWYTVIHRAEGAPCPDLPKNIKVHVKDVKAEITFDTNTVKAPVFCFENLSEGGTKYYWTFEDGDPARYRSNTKDSVCSNFRDHLGTKTVCLKAENEIKCADTTCVDIVNDYYFMIYVPNVFTPENSPGKNDFFTVTSKNIEHYDMKIFNRWGQLVFQSIDPNEHWDGNDILSGKACPGGTYYFVLDYNFYHLSPVRLSGTATLIR